jgi:hypothetical protein
MVTVGSAQAELLNIELKLHIGWKFTRIIEESRKSSTEPKNIVGKLESLSTIILIGETHAHCSKSQISIINTEL